MGLTFKENTPDLRNTRVVDIYRELADFGLSVDVYDPWVEPKEALREYGIRMSPELQPAAYDGIVLAVAHDEFRQLGPSRLRQAGKHPHVFYDLKSLFATEDSDIRL
jgi:UDP-N-acetyl-D-galactosamine dehydrogenase